MPDLKASTVDELYDELNVLEASLQHEPAPADPAGPLHQQILRDLRRVGLIHIELTRRTATGWRPM